MALLYRMGSGNGSGGDLKPYTVNFECASGYIGQTLTMTYKGTPHAGETVDNVSGTVGSDGTLTLYPMHSGEWECSCYSSVTGTTMKKTIDLSYWGIQPTVTFEDAPDGATVTPTDDVQTWLHCADIWDKSYTRVDEVIADTTTLNTLIANENANNYLVRSTSFATDLCVNETAMTYIGLNNYCANKLLADSTWSEAICNSTYFEKVLNVKVPSNPPSANVLYSSYYAGQPANNVFDNNPSTTWSSEFLNYNGKEYIGYKFDSKVCIKKLVFTERAITYEPVITNMILRGRNSENEEWNDIGLPYSQKINDKSSNLKDEKKFPENTEFYLMYGLFYLNAISGSYNMLNPTCSDLQFYGREGA